MLLMSFNHEVVDCSPISAERTGSDNVAKPRLSIRDKFQRLVITDLAAADAAKY